MVKPSNSSRPLRRILPRERPLQALRDRLQGRLLLGRLPEGADDHGHGGHRAHALPADVAHDEPHTVRGVLHRVQIAADEGPLLGGLVAGRDLQAADALGGLGQDGALGRLGDLAHGGELLTAAPHDAVHDTGEYGDGGDRDEFGDGVGVVTAGVSEMHPEYDGDGREAGQESAAGREEGGRDERSGGEQGHAGERRQRDVVVDRPGDDEQRGQQAYEEPGPGQALLRHPPVSSSLPHHSSPATVRVGPVSAHVIGPDPRVHPGRTAGDPVGPTG